MKNNIKIEVQVTYLADQSNVAQNQYMPLLITLRLPIMVKSAHSFAHAIGTFRMKVAMLKM